MRDLSKTLAKSCQIWHYVMQHFSIFLLKITQIRSPGKYANGIFHAYWREAVTSSTGLYYITFKITVSISNTLIVTVRCSLYCYRQTYQMLHCVLLVAGRRTAASDGIHWWCCQWTAARVCPTKWWSHTGASQLKWVVAGGPAVYRLLNGIPNSVNRLVSFPSYSRPRVRRLKSQWTWRSAVTAQVRQGVLGSMWRRAVLLEGPRVLLASCTNID